MHPTLRSWVIAWALSFIGLAFLLGTVPVIGLEEFVIRPLLMKQLLAGTLVYLCSKPENPFGRSMLQCGLHK